MEGLIPPPKRRGGFATDTLDDEPPTVEDPMVLRFVEEEQARKKAKKEPSGRGKKGKKGLTLEELEEQEGGAVKESKVGMAASKRADRRKRKAPGDETEMLAVNDLVDVEEALEQEEDEGVKLEPFNLAREREEGHFDEGGNYVENKEEDDPTMKDPWLTSEDAGVLSDEVRKKIEAQQARVATAEAAPEITPRQTADLFREMIAILQPGETATKALKRLRPQAPARRGKKKDVKEGKKEETEEEKQAKAAFEKLTETASTLMDAGELDVYSTSREALDARAQKHPAEKDDFDIFGGDDDDDDVGSPQPAAAAQSEQQGSVNEGTAAEHRSNGFASTSAPSTLPAQEAETDYDSWPVKELARFLRERGHDPAGSIEKPDLVAKVKELAAQGPEGEQPSAPLGYVWDPASNLFYSSESGMYYDAGSGGFYSPSDGKWYAYDEASKEFQELPAATGQ